MPNLSNENQVLLVVKVLVQDEDIVRVCITHSVNVSQQLDFIQRLVQEVFVVLNDLQAHIRARVCVFTGQCGRKAAEPK